MKYICYVTNNMLQQIQTHKKILPPLLVVAFIFILLSLNAESNGSLTTLAADIQERCDTKEGYRRKQCYDEEIPKLMDKGLSMEEAFEVGHIVQSADNAYIYCHVLGHYLAEKETAKDPSKWQEVIARIPSGVCANGGLHGAFQERFGAEAVPDASIDELAATLDGTCESRRELALTREQQSMCVHGLGHLLIYMTGGDVATSLSTCENTAVAMLPGGHDARTTCYSGVFMQIFQPLDPEDFALVEGLQPEKEKLQTYCADFSGKKQWACFKEGWPLYFTELQKPEGLVRFCSALTPQGDEAVTFCYEELFFVLSALRFKSEPQNVAAYCPHLPQKRAERCFANAAVVAIRLNWKDIPRAVLICESSRPYGYEDACYDNLISIASFVFHPDSKELAALCEAVPESWKNTCYQKYI